MLEVIPSVNAETWDKVKEQILKVAAYTDWVELDIFDGKFAPRVSWNNPADLKSLSTDRTVKLAVHLMVADPESQLESWIKAGVRRIIVQWEALKPKGLQAIFTKAKTRQKVQAMLNLCKENWVEFGLSLSPSSSISEIREFLPELSLVQVLANTPGDSGRNPSPRAFQMAAELDKIRRQEKLNCKLEWDIGVNPETLDAIRRTGVDLVSATSFIFNASNPVQALEYLRRQARGLV